MTLTYLDSGVLIKGWRERSAPASAVRALLENGDRMFIASRIQRLETIAKIKGPLNRAEWAYYSLYFDTLASVFIVLDESLGFDAEKFMLKYDLSVPDALHVACALRAGADELVTTEGLTKPMHRVTELRVAHLPPSPQPSTP